MSSSIDQISALVSAGTRVNGGLSNWLGEVVPVDVFADLLAELEADGWVLARKEDA